MVNSRDITCMRHIWLIIKSRVSVTLLQDYQKSTQKIHAPCCFHRVRYQEEKPCLTLDQITLEHLMGITKKKRRCVVCAVDYSFFFFYWMLLLPSAADGGLVGCYIMLRLVSDSMMFMSFLLMFSNFVLGHVFHHTCLME